MTLEESVKVLFADRVLEIMEEQKEWNADTLDLIRDVAVSHGLARSTDSGHFKRD